jgi:hypothetical protein
MDKNKLMRYSLVHSLGVLVYILLVSLIMNNGQYLFGKTDTIATGVAVLLLFVLSATIVASLVLGRPILWYWDGNKKEALKLFFLTVLWLFLQMIAGFAILAFVNFYA